MRYVAKEIDSVWCVVQLSPTGDIRICQAVNRYVAENTAWMLTEMRA